MRHTLPRVLLAAVVLGSTTPLGAQEPRVVDTAQGVTIDLINADLRSAVQLLSQYMDRPVLFSGVQGQPVTLQTPRPVPRSDVPGLLRTLLESNNYELVEAGSAYQVRPRGGAAAGAGQVPQQGIPNPAMQMPPGRTGSGGMELNVIRLRHARAADVAATVNALYGRGGAVGEVAGRGSTLAGHLREQQVPPAGMGVMTGTAGTVAAGGQLSGDLILVPDSRTNSLLVRATRMDFEIIRAAVAQVDVRPLQVIIEALVAEVRRSSTFDWGVGARLPPTQVRGTRTVIDAQTATPPAAELLVRAFNVTGLNLDVVLAAGVARGDVTILSRPLVIAANNEEAEVNVGSQQPFIQVQRTTDGGALDQIIQYRDVGTTLRVLPTISPEGDVMLRVTQEVNSATGETGVREAPVISTRSIQTQLLVRDGETVVLGGLVDTQRDRARGGIPFLSSVPLLGGFFGRRSRRSLDSELFVFLTPRVIYTEDDLGAATEDVRGNSRFIRGATKRVNPYVLPRPAKPSARVPAAAEGEADQE